MGFSQYEIHVKRSLEVWINLSEVRADILCIITWLRYFKHEYDYCSLNEVNYSSIQQNNIHYGIYLGIKKSHLTAFTNNNIVNFFHFFLLIVYKYKKEEKFVKSKLMTNALNVCDLEIIYFSGKKNTNNSVKWSHYVVQPYITVNIMDITWAK